MLPGPAFRSEKSGTMHILKIAVGEFVSGFGVFCMSFVDSQMPFRIFLKPTLPYELVLLRWGRLLFAPCAFAVHNYLSLVNQHFCVLQRRHVYLNWTTRLMLVSDCERSGAKSPDSCSQNQERLRFYFHGD
jgi:hypothetical protein